MVIGFDSHVFLIACFNGLTHRSTGQAPACHRRASFIGETIGGGMASGVVIATAAPVAAAAVGYGVYKLVKWFKS